MSSDIVLTSALRSNLLSLQNTQNLIDQTQLRLATGLKVNSALDNPSNFFAAQSLDNRAGDLTRLLDGISQSIRTIEEADNGITALTNLVEQAESVAIEAQSEARTAEGFALIRGTEDLRGVNLTTDLAEFAGGESFTIIVEEADGTSTTAPTVTSPAATVTLAANDTIDNIVAQINSDTNNTDLVRASVTSAGQLQIESLVDGASIRVQDSADSGAGGTEFDLAGFNAIGLGDFVQAEDNDAGGTAAIRYGGTAIAGSTLSSTRALLASQVNGNYVASATLNAAGFLTTGAAGTDELRINVSVDDQQSANIDVAQDTTIQELIDNINNDANIGGSITASFNTDTGAIELQAADGVGTVEIQYEDLTGTANPNFGFGTNAGDGAIGTANDVNSERFTFVGTSVDLAQFEADFNNIREQIDGIVEDAEYRGVNLLGGDDLTTFFNEDRDNLLTTQGVDFSANGLGIAEGSFTTSASIQLSIDDIRSALDDVRSFGSSIANDLSIIQTRQDFTEQTINTLEAGADDLTVADQNEEGANLLALQTRQTLGVTSLSLASQSQQAVLRLF